MKRPLRILLVAFIIGCLVERYILTQWYTLELGNFDIEVMSDECHACFMDWTFTHTISIDLGNGENRTFKFNTEGPRLEFGLNKDRSQLLVNCPGFSSLFIDLPNMQNKTVVYGMKDKVLDMFLIQWVVNRNKELLKLEQPRLPDKNWEE